MANPHVVVVGSCMTDLVSYTTRLPKPGETIHGHRFSIGFGGKGANQCIAATRLGASTAMVAMVGDDSFGQNYLQNFRDNGVDISHVGVTKEAATGVAPIAVDDSVKTLMNAAPADASLDPSIIQNSDVFCVNETEAEVLTSICIKNVKDAERAAEELLSRGCGSVIITLGGEGALYSTSQGHMHVSAEKVTPVDTTGAGDAFVGALAYYMASHSQLDMVEMIRRSCKVATVSVQAPGTQSSYPARDKLPNEIFA